MHARSLVWLLLVGNLAACRSKSEQAPSPPPAGGSGAAGSAGSATGAIADAGVPVAVAVVDADAADAGAADAALDAAPQTIELGTKVPDFGCLGWSPQRGLAACVVGSRSTMNLGDTRIALAFVGASAEVEPPPSITILEVPEGSGQGSDEILPALAARLASALRGFVPWDRSRACITSTREGDQLVMSPPISVGGMRISVRTRKELPASSATQFSAMLTVRMPSGAEHVVAETTGSISGLEVRAFALRDRAGHSSVLIEQDHGIADEGIYGGAMKLWRCTTAGCDELEL